MVTGMINLGKLPLETNGLTLVSLRESKPILICIILFINTAHTSMDMPRYTSRGEHNYNGGQGGSRTGPMWSS